MDNIELDPNRIVDKLLIKIGRLELENTMLEVQIEKLEEDCKKESKD